MDDLTKNEAAGVRRTIFDALNELSSVSNRIYDFVFVSTPEKLEQSTTPLPSDKINIAISEIDRITRRLRMSADKLEGLGK